MDSSQAPLVAGLLTSLLSATPAPSISTPYPTALPSQTFPAPSLFASDTPNHDGEGGGIHQWSSLIGIVTALIGNVLISLALNIQRYAHIRISREWEQDKIQKVNGWKRSHPNANTAATYGTIGGAQRQRNGATEQHQRIRHNDFEEYRDEDGEYAQEELPDGHRESDASDRTARSGDKPAEAGDRKSYLRSPYWWVGLVLMCLGETGNFLAYGFAPASIVSPLGVVALISNCIIAPCLLKEQFRQRDFWGVLVAIAGAVVVVLSAKSEEKKIGPHEIWIMITRWEFELYLGLTIALIIGLMWASGRYGSRTILIDVGLVALFGGYTALSTKGVSSLLSFTLWHVITFPITYLLVFVLVFSALMQIRYINRALQRFDSTQVIPTQFVLFTLSVIIGSAVLYRDFESIPATRATKFVGGCLLTFSGVYFITSGRVRADDESTLSSEDEEESIGLLDGERYRDRVDPSLSGSRQPAQKASQQAAAERSPLGSLLSHDAEGIDENQSTPRGALSAAPSSPGGSLAADSTLSAPTPELYPSSLRPPSRMSNPWADLHGSSIENESEPQAHRPATPPDNLSGTAPSSTVLLRFPPAPGLEEARPSNGEAALVRRASTPTGVGPSHPSDRNGTPFQTPPRHPLRNSISTRFSPGPLLPTLSTGFSAVVAESLRRGDSLSFKDRSKRKLARRRRLDGVFLDGTVDRDADADPSAAEGDGSFTPLTIATARLQSATSLAAAPPEAGRSTPALATEIYTTRTERTEEGGSRVRSLSDSVGGGLAWLGGALRKVHPVKGVESVAATDALPSPQNEDTHPAQGGSDWHRDTDADAETHR